MAMVYGLNQILPNHGLPMQTLSLTKANQREKYQGQQQFCLMCQQSWILPLNTSLAHAPCTLLDDPMQTHTCGVLDLVLSSLTKPLRLVSHALVLPRLLIRAVSEISDRSNCNPFNDICNARQW